MARIKQTPRTRVLAFIALLGTGGILLAACSGTGTALAVQACQHVKRSLALYEKSQRGGADSQTLYQEAVHQLVLAEPLAARATSDAPQWNPLMTTLHSINKTPEAALITGLKAQCAAATGASVTPNAHATSTTTVGNTAAANGA